MAAAPVCESALDGVTDVIILAGLVGDPITKKYPREHDLINEHGVRNFLDSLGGRGLNKVIFVSTCSNYGEIPLDALADETFALKPLSLYAKAKVSHEQRLLGLKNSIDYAPTILRFATAFGLSGRMRFDLTVSEFTRDLFAGKRLEVYDADTWRPYCHVRDFARAMRRVLEMPVDAVAFEIFNAGGQQNNFTKKMIVEAIQKQIRGAEVDYVSGGGDRRNYRVNFSKMRERLHFEPLFGVEDGVRELIAALKSGFFADFESRPNFYRNGEISYAGV
jgi:nucleoside-diphosphate-sugar epimerase